MWREGGQGMEVWGAASAGVGAELPGQRSQKAGMADTGQGGGEAEEAEERSQKKPCHHGQSRL